MEGAHERNNPEDERQCVDGRGREGEQRGEADEVEAEPGAVDQDKSSSVASFHSACKAIALGRASAAGALRANDPD